MEKSNKRYEYKFVVKNMDCSQLKQIVLLHPASFQKAYKYRWINNVYYDTHDLISFGENSAGINRRTKYRIRWYGENYNQMSNPILEIKQKKNKLGWKEYLPLKGSSLKQVESYLSTKSPKFHNLKATTQNRYKRHYYISSDQKFRITIDENISFKPPHSKQAFVQEEKLVLEVKFDLEHQNEAGFIFSNLPLRQTKNSKYSSGIKHQLQI